MIMTCECSNTDKSLTLYLATATPWIGEVKGLVRLLGYSVIDFYNIYFTGSKVHKQTAIVRVPETLTNFNPMCTPADIAETYEAKHAWLSIRPHSYNDTLTPPHEPML